MRITLKTAITTTLVAMMAMGITSCKSHKSIAHQERTPTIEQIHVGKGDNLHNKIVEEALSWVGTPYEYAGVRKGEGTDCSGMVMKVYEDIAGYKIPRNSAKQAEFCQPLEAEDVRLGDLIFFATGKDINKVSHVGIVIDDHRFVHASASKGVVVSEIFTPYYQRTFKMFGRVPEQKEKQSDLADR